MTRKYVTFALDIRRLDLQTLTLTHYSMLFNGKKFWERVAILYGVYIALLARNILMQNILQITKSLSL